MRRGRRPHLITYLLFMAKFLQQQIGVKNRFLAASIGFALFHLSVCELDRGSEQVLGSIKQMDVDEKRQCCLNCWFLENGRHSPILNLPISICLLETAVFAVDYWLLIISPTPHLLITTAGNDRVPN